MQIQQATLLQETLRPYPRLTSVGWLRSTVGGMPVLSCPALDLQLTGDHYVFKLVLLRILSSRPSPRTFPQFVRVQVLGFLAAENDGFET